VIIKRQFVYPTTWYYTNGPNILTQFHFVKEKVLEQKVKFEYVRTDEDEADGFTKGIGTVKFEKNMGFVVGKTNA
jgi:hypothetical protein